METAQYLILENLTVVTWGMDIETLRSVANVFKANANDCSSVNLKKKTCSECFHYPWKRCIESFQCQDSSKEIHFKFDRFDVEKNFDYLVIGNPIRFENYHYDHFASIDDENSDDFAESNGFILGGSQQTGIWVNAKSIPAFDIYFFRRVFIRISRSVGYPGAFVYAKVNKNQKVIMTLPSPVFEWLLNVEYHYRIHQMLWIFISATSIIMVNSWLHVLPKVLVLIKRSEIKIFMKS